MTPANGKPKNGSRPQEQAHFCFHGELNDFLPHARRGVTFAYTFYWRASIKDMIESLGVPHSEIELLTVDDTPVDFNYLVHGGVTINAYDHATASAIPHQLLLQAPLNGKPAFVLDTHLGRLATYLRMMGFDTLYRNDYPDDELAHISNAEDRILLTRDIGLLKRSLVTYGRYVRATNPRLQLMEIMQRYTLPPMVVPFRRCLKCNGELSPVSIDDIRDRISPETAMYYDEFFCCRDCAQIYWKGSHYERMQDFMAQVMNGG